MDTARRLWTLAEPYHAIVYFGTGMRPAYEAAGLRGFWRGYFAGRAAPMGAVGTGTVVATFFGFHPGFVGRAVPDVWSRATPEVALAARLEGVDASLRTLGDVDDEVHGAAADLLTAAMEACSPGGRPLFAANADLARPDEPHLALWHATTLLREHRGDGHVGALLAAGVGPCEAHVLRVAADGNDPESVQPHRGWSDDDWGAATDSLRGRGWLDHGGAVTSRGAEQHEAIESLTDHLAAEPLRHLGERLERLVPLLTRAVEPVLAAGLVPYPNPMGVPAPR